MTEILELTSLQATVLQWYMGHPGTTVEIGGLASRGWRNSVRSLIRRKMLSEDKTGRLSVTGKGTQAANKEQGL
jgi:hypothetical protein